MSLSAFQSPDEEAIAEPSEYEPIHVLIAKVSRAISAVAKDRKASMGNAGTYQFRGIDDAVDAVHGPLSENNVTPLPKIISIERNERTNNQGKVQTIVNLHLCVRFIGPRGDYVEADALSEAQDYGDKAITKAMSVAFRTILFQVFTIPVSDSAVSQDIEDENEPRVAPQKNDVPVSNLDKLRTAWKDLNEQQQAQFKKWWGENLPKGESWPGKTFESLPEDRYPVALAAAEAIANGIHPASINKEVTTNEIVETTVDCSELLEDLTDLQEEAFTSYLGGKGIGNVQAVPSDRVIDVETWAARIAAGEKLPDGQKTED